jgi:ATP-dependent RNA helicase A
MSCFLFPGTKFSLRFICEVSVTGHNYVGVGNSTNKKDAQGNASKDFLSYLIRQGFVTADSLPSVCSEIISVARQFLL